MLSLRRINQALMTIGTNRKLSQNRLKLNKINI